MTKMNGKGGNRGDKPGSGPGGYCVCRNCGYRLPHIVNRPCNQMYCPKCGSPMTKA